MINDNGRAQDRIEYVTREEFREFEIDFREWKAIVNTKLDRFEKMESEINAMNQTLTRMDERQEQIHSQMILQNKQTNDTMRLQFEQLANAIDRIVDHLISSNHQEQSKG